MKSENDTFAKYGITSGTGLKQFLEDAGVYIESVYNPAGTDNVIHLPHLITLNWKKTEGIVRLNCKEDVVQIIEKKTNLKHIQNYKSDPTHPHSFIIGEFSDLIDVIAVLKSIEED